MPKFIIKITLDYTDDLTYSGKDLSIAKQLLDLVPVEEPSND